MRNVMMALALVVATGCATANQNVAKVLVVACEGCGVLQSSGACMVAQPIADTGGGVSSSSRSAPQTEAVFAPPAAQSVTVPKCVAPKQPWVVNFSDVMDKKAAPLIECR